MNATRKAAEIWLPVDIAGYEDKYEVSNLGKVRSLPRKVARGSHYMTLVGRRTPIYFDKAGYPRVTLCRNNESRSFLVHRLVLLSFADNPGPEFEVCHINGDPSDSRVINLRWDMHSGNERDKRQHGTQYNVNKTHCPKGHPYSGSNLYVTPKGYRSCRACVQKRVNEFKRKQRLSQCGSSQTPRKRKTR